MRSGPCSVAGHKLSGRPDSTPSTTVDGTATKSASSPSVVGARPICGDGALGIGKFTPSRTMSHQRTRLRVETAVRWRRGVLCRLQCQHRDPRIDENPPSASGFEYLTEIDTAVSRVDAALRRILGANSTSITCGRFRKVARRFLRTCGTLPGVQPWEGQRPCIRRLTRVGAVKGCQAAACGRTIIMPLLLNFEVRPLASRIASRHQALTMCSH